MLELLAAARAGRRVPAGDGPGTAPSGPSRASNNRLRTAGHRPPLAPRPGLAGPIRAEDIVRIQASNRRLCSPPAPTHVRAFAPQGPVPLAQPARADAPRRAASKLPSQRAAC
uniref:Uncharacterized protein n=1 Tax=Zea mays TaxID=4577 RepID=A0A804RSJ6_MAIZE